MVDVTTVNVSQESEVICLDLTELQMHIIAYTLLDYITYCISQHDHIVIYYNNIWKFWNYNDVVMCSNEV